MTTRVPVCHRPPDRCGCGCRHEVRDDPVTVRIPCAVPESEAAAAPTATAVSRSLRPGSASTNDLERQVVAALRERQNHDRPCRGVKVVAGGIDRVDPWKRCCSARHRRWRTRRHRRHRPARPDSRSRVGSCPARDRGSSAPATPRPGGRWSAVPNDLPRRR